MCCGGAIGVLRVKNERGDARNGSSKKGGGGEVYHQYNLLKYFSKEVLRPACIQGLQEGQGGGDSGGIQRKEPQRRKGRKGASLSMISKRTVAKFKTLRCRKGILREKV